MENKFNAAYIDRSTLMGFEDSFLLAHNYVQGAQNASTYSTQVYPGVSSEILPSAKERQLKVQEWWRPGSSIDRNTQRWWDAEMKRIMSHRPQGRNKTRQQRGRETEKANCKVTRGQLDRIFVEHKGISWGNGWVPSSLHRLSGKVKAVH